MVLSAKIGYIMPLIKYIAVKNVKLIRKLTMLHVGNT